MANGVGKVKRYSDNPLLQEYYSRRALIRDMEGGSWKLAAATANNRRIILGNGDVAAQQPASMPEWQRKLGGKPRTASQKRALRAIRSYSGK